MSMSTQVLLLDNEEGYLADLLYEETNLSEEEAQDLARRLMQQLRLALPKGYGGQED